jgi:hypothetical protein
VTRGTRPKKPSSSRGFACATHGARGARGAWGSWGLKTENLNFFLSFQAGNNYQKIFKKINLFFIFYFFRASVRTADCVRRRGGGDGTGGGKGGEGRERERMSLSAG